MEWRNILAIALIMLLGAEAKAFSPQVEGLGGAGRAGLAKEGMFSNPASPVLLKTNVVFAVHTQTKMRDLGAGGVAQAAGVYDGSSEFAHGGLGFIRESRRIGVGSGSTYVHQSTIRGVIARPIFGDLSMGARTNYTMHKENGTKNNYFHGDVGFLYPVFSDLPLGLTVENVTDKAGERPRTIFGALSYDVMGPLDLYADLGFVVSKVKSANRVWGIGVEVAVFDEILLRGGLHRDSVLDERGWSTGLAWAGPRASLEYALRMTTNRPSQRDHVFGMSIQL